MSYATICHFPEVHLLFIALFKIISSLSARMFGNSSEKKLQHPTLKKYSVRIKSTSLKILPIYTVSSG